MNQFHTDDISDSAFQLVEGRLGMNENKSFFMTTVEEMKRRIDGPERLNSSNMACNLRKSKAKNGGDKLRDELKNHGVDLQRNRSQRGHPTKLTALVEGETVQIAQDLQEIVNEEYPTGRIAEEVVLEAKSEVFIDKESFEECMSALHSTLSSVVPPITGIAPKASENKNLNHSMEDFSMMTHGLGILTSRIWFEEMKGIGEGMLKVFNQ